MRIVMALYPMISDFVDLDLFHTEGQIIQNTIRAASKDKAMLNLIST